MDHLTDSLKLCVDLSIGKSENLQTMPLQHSTSCFIMLSPILSIVL